MATVFISIGSNIDRYRNITSALDSLAAEYGELGISSVYESEAIGFEGDNFLNLVVSFETGSPVGEIAAVMRRIEDENGRDRSGPRFSSRTLDLDILTWGDLVGEIDGVLLPRDEITSNAFVLWPMAEIAPDEKYPETGESYRSLWESYDKSKQQLWPVEFEWQGETISSK